MDRRNPFDEIERLFDQINQQFEQFEPERALGGDVAVDVADRGDAFEVTADLPGYATDEVDVTLPDPTTLRISATHEETVETSDEGEESDEGDEEAVERRYLRRERHRQSVSRTVSLPERVDEAETSATYEHGVLTVTLPKQSGAEGTNIPVN